MIKKSTFILSLAFVFLLSGCESISNLLTVEIDTDFKVDLPVEVSSTPLKSGPASYSFDVTESFNPTDDPDVADIVARIKTINLTSLTAMVGSLSRESFTILDANLTISSGVDSVNYTFANVLITDGTFLTISDENGSFKKVSDMLTGLNAIKVDFAGSVDSSPTTFTLFTILGSVVDAGI